MARYVIVMKSGAEMMAETDRSVYLVYSRLNVASSVEQIGDAIFKTGDVAGIYRVLDEEGDPS